MPDLPTLLEQLRRDTAAALEEKRADDHGPVFDSSEELEHRGWLEGYVDALTEVLTILDRQGFLAGETDDEPRVYGHVRRERARAHEKHGLAGSMEIRRWDDPAWLPVLTEEVGEVARALCELALGNLQAGGARVQLAQELVQVAAMACAWADACDGVEIIPGVGRG